MMGLADRVFVLRLQVNCTPWSTIRPAGNYHPRAPRCWGVGFNTFKHSNPHTSLKIGIDLILPVNQGECWFVNGYWYRIWVNMQSERFTIHKRLMFAHIKSSRTIVVK